MLLHNLVLPEPKASAVRRHDDRPEGRRRAALQPVARGGRESLRPAGIGWFELVASSYEFRSDRMAWRIRRATLHSGPPKHRFEQRRTWSATERRIPTSLRMGVMHIFTGIDHMSFMLRLRPSFPRRVARSPIGHHGFPRCGHSLDAGARSHWPSAPGRRSLIDALVALTITLIGLENIGDSTCISRYR